MTRLNICIGPILGVALLVTSCGKNIDSTSQNTQQDTLTVNGVAGFGSQCAYGTIKDPVPIQLQVFNCPINKQTMDLAQPLLPFILQADCQKMEVTARTTEGIRIENRWKALPDGRFYFSMDAGNAVLKDDGAGNSGCSTPLVIDVAGIMKCRDRDHAEVQVDASWYMGQTMPGTTPHLTSQPCQLPKACTLHGFVDLNQCN